MTGATSIKLSSAQSHHNGVAAAYFEHSSAPRVNTDIVVIEALRREYPQLHLSVAPKSPSDLLAFAAAGHAAAAPIDQEEDRLSWRHYVPPARRLNGESDGLAEVVHFGKFLYDWRGKEYVLYVVDGRDGMDAYPQVVNQYLLSSSVQAADRLLLEAGRWNQSLHDEVLVFDMGQWQKSHELWESVQHSEWENVILDEDMKRALVRDAEGFFNGRETYTKLKVPWKRGVIYYGPPGNGKTISIKAMMHSLYKREDPIPTLYVKTLASSAPPEYSVRRIFDQARRYAPCYLIFEDLDSLITDRVRSYFLNEIDGLKANEGILMVGSTNHLDRLDPGIAKRPSRFDRKYFFPNPDEAQRVKYAKFWQGKLDDNKDIEFPDELCEAIAKITDGFSFAYMQEAFIAALLVLAGRRDFEMDENDKECMDGDEASLIHFSSQKAPGTVMQVTPAGLLNRPPRYVITRNPDSAETSWRESVQYLQQHARAVLYDEDRCITPQLTPAEAGELGLVAKYEKALLQFWYDEDGVPPKPRSFEGHEDQLDRLPLWRELKKQVKLLKDEMDEKKCTQTLGAGELEESFAGMKV